MGKKWNNIKNLFGPSKVFFDKEATIKEYFAVVPEEERPDVEDYEELYQIALLVVGKQDFMLNTLDQDPYFHELSSDECLIAVLVGALAYAVVREVDIHGTKIEKAIDNIIPKDYDKNNPFDTKKGYGHRIFGHDPVAFGLKSIPKKTLIRVKGFDRPVRIGEFLDVGLDGNVSMWELIWRFYGDGHAPFSGVMNCIGHIIVHFGKDLLTPAGLPLPMVSLFDKYDYHENMDAYVLNYKGSWMQKLANEHLTMRASDFASLIFIEAILSMYCSKKNYGEKQAGFRQDMKLISIGTCLSLQMATCIIGGEVQVGKRGGKSVISGGNVNLLLTGAYIKVLLEETRSIVEARSAVNKAYDEV